MSTESVSGASLPKLTHVLFFVFLFICIVFALPGRVFWSTKQQIWVQDDVEKDTVLRGGISPNSLPSQPLLDSKQPHQGSFVDSRNRETLSKPKLTNATKIIFLRIPKTGSRTLGSLVQEQAKKKGFGYKNFLSDVEIPIRRDFMNHRQGRHVFAARMRYMEFQWQESPSYISMVRDPIARFTSNFYFSLHGDVGNHTASYTLQKRKEMKKNTGNSTIPTLSECVLRDIPFCTEYHRLFSILTCFCGEDPRCKQPSSWTFAKAVKHIDSSLAVGLNEEFEGYLLVLERFMPEFFLGIVEIYRRPQSPGALMVSYTKTKFKEPLSAEADSKLRRTLEMGYRIYNFTRDCFHQIKTQLRMIQESHYINEALVFCIGLSTVCRGRNTSTQKTWHGGIHFHSLFLFIVICQRWCQTIWGSMLLFHLI
ncbi:uronyl 2-sulfotransferase-like [Acanthaster planci]|uniref:Uronyl 2-sulfotransferase-like n=1 Tax=Acanthaster planci TaxID=133434 RepID=A0A8B7XMU9_ACAPL|nr:uronyl 2-sulfotransferase-like [Acanthaster planci]XP_022082150.1 uronyl 2-sulfotransferase-like [Acanthaster planci]